MYKNKTDEIKKKSYPAKDKKYGEKFTAGTEWKDFSKSDSSNTDHSHE